MSDVTRWWDDLKSWFKYSESILLARMVAFTGLITSAIGLMDWSPLLSLDVSSGFSQAQVIWLGAVTFVQGLVAEFARRRNDPYMTVSTAVEAQPAVIKAKKQIKKTLTQVPEVQ